MSPYIAFAIGMLILAVSPGPGLAVVLSRAISFGPKSGFKVVSGLIIADFVFLGISVVGLTALVQVLGPWFALLKYFAALYLVYLGISSIMGASSGRNTSAHTSSISDVSSGLLTTLANPKAILFYAAFLPGFFEIEKLALLDIGYICLVIVLVSFSAYGAYIYMAMRAKNAWAIRWEKLLQRLSGATLVGAGLIVASRQ